MEHASRFDRAYYDHFYRDAKTRVAEPRYYRDLAKFIAAYVNLHGISVRSIVDLGCGVGTLKKPLLQNFPAANYVGVEHSEYACRKFDWIQSCVSEYRDPNRFDLVVCHDVLQYLDDDRAVKALQNLNRLCGAVLYFSVLTLEDWHHKCDQSKTDDSVNFRPASWYRKLLQKKFINLGGGVYLTKRTDVIVYELEAID